MHPKIRLLLAMAFLGLWLTGCSFAEAKHHSAVPSTTTPHQPSSLPPTPSPTSLPPTGSPPAALPTPATKRLTASNFHIGARITRNLTGGQVAFLNQNYAYVMTPLLGSNIRQIVQQPKLLLYRSIQGTWEGFTQFDWAHIDANEQMFLHHGGRRIKTVWDSWLMNPGDFVGENAPDALDHWINYYALTAAQQVHEYDYDGLFIDSASHWLNPHAVDGVMPDDYDLSKWHDDRVRALAYIKAQLPDKIVVFNGLHNEHGAEDSLANTDGGMWETFAFQPQTGKYQGEEKWRAAIELTARHPESAIVLVVKEQPDLNADIQKRIFSVGSYLLVSRDNVAFSMTDAEHPKTNALVYYPEYMLDLGAPRGAFTQTEDGLYMRAFEKGLVLVNPSETKTLTTTLGGEYRRVVPVGGGEVPADGNWRGRLNYEPLSGQVAIPPVSALILVRP